MVTEVFKARMQKLLELKDISKSFPGVKALSNVSFDLYAGEVLALLGENGAGKSTLMKILSGVYSKDSGHIFKKGKLVEIKNTQDAMKLGINIVYQEFNLCPHLSVAENMFLAREFKTNNFVLNKKKQNEEALRIMNILKQKIYPTEKVSNLSVGEQQIVEIAKALTVDCDVLVLDEPSAALTETEIKNLFEVIVNLKGQNKGIIYISHRLHELEDIADRVTVIRDGKKIDTVDYKSTNVQHLIKLMVGRDINNLFPIREDKITDKVILEVNNFSQKNKLFDINFSLKEGEVLGIAGLMGAGRTELARAIFGADSKNSGNLVMMGKKMHINSPLDAITQGLGYLTEDRKKDGLLLNLNVLDNTVLSTIEEYSRYKVVNNAKTQEITKKYVTLLKTKTPSIFKKVGQLSGGNQQKVIVARWLARQSKILIFDEPTRGIDVGAKYEIYEIINELVRKGVGVILISSELPELLGMCTRILVMNSGHIAGECDVSSSNQEEIMQLATLNIKEKRNTIQGEVKI